eukprot:m.530837 g.530837  ORF g.530837 m.530837 type:complete len:57 (-) comp57571_c0_seq1:110-280(-)
MDQQKALHSFFYFARITPFVVLLFFFVVCLDLIYFDGFRQPDTCPVIAVSAPTLAA